MICPNCGTQNRAGAKFCLACGTRLPEQTPAAEAVSEPAPEAQPVATEMPAQTPAPPAVASATAVETEVPVAAVADDAAAAAPTALSGAEQASAPVPETESVQGQEPIQAEVPEEGQAESTALAGAANAEADAADIPTQADPVLLQEAVQDVTEPAASAPRSESAGAAQASEPVPSVEGAADNTAVEASPVPAASAAQPEALTPLAPGTVVVGRFHLLELVEHHPEVNFYRVQDLSYCPVCNAEITDKDDLYCANCGAQLTTPRQELLEERLAPAAASQAPSQAEAATPTLAQADAAQVSENAGAQTESASAETQTVAETQNAAEPASSAAAPIAQAQTSPAAPPWQEGNRLYRLTAAAAPAVLEPATAPQEGSGWRLTFGQCSDRGMVREVDEDSVFSLVLSSAFQSVNRPCVGLFIVADGVGGAGNGEVASRIAVQTTAQVLLQRLLFRELSDQRPSLDEIEQALHEALGQASQAVYTARVQANSNMGTTMTLAYVQENQAVIANVGDSRTYLWGRDGLKAITRDHSLIYHLIETGRQPPEAIYTYPQRNIIYRSIGDKATTEVDTFRQTLSAGDRLILCCDGVWEMIHNEGIERTLASLADPQQACDQMIADSNLAGGDDNISVIVVQLDATHELPRP